MTVLQIEIGGYYGDLVAVAELVDSELDIRQAAVASDAPTQFDVRPGAYQLRVRWSDGRTDKQRLAVGSDDVVVSIEPPNTEPPDLISLGDPQSIAGATPRVVDPIDSEILRRSADPGRTLYRSSNLRRIDDSFAAVRPQIDMERFALPEILPTFAVWRKGDHGWENLGLDAPSRDIPGGLEFEVYLDSGLHLFEVSGREQNQYVSIPAERSIIALRWLRIDGRRHLRVDARTTDPAIETLRGYIARGNVELAHGIAPNVLAERKLQAKMAAPRVAALGAYFLLRVGDFERLHNWPDNLTNWQPWLPDGPVIAAWQRLRSTDPDLPEVRRLLLEAERRGMPIYTEGVRLLKDGLELFANDIEADWDVEEPRRRVEAYAMAMDWAKSETTYAGYAPDDPRPTVGSSEIAWGAQDIQTVHANVATWKAVLDAHYPMPSGRAARETRLEDPVDVRLGRLVTVGQPFIGRLLLRESLGEMLRPDGPQILVVNGPRGSGNSVTTQFIDQIARQTGAFRVAPVVVDSERNPKFGAEDVARVLGARMGVPLGDVPTREPSKRYLPVLATWLLAEAERSGSNWWWVFDNFTSGGRPSDVGLLIDELAQMLAEGRSHDRLVLLDFDESLPVDERVSVIRERLPDPSEIGSREVQHFIRAALEATGRQMNDHDIDYVAELMLAGLPSGAGRLEQLDLTLSEFEQALLEK